MNALITMLACLSFAGALTAIITMAFGDHRRMPKDAKVALAILLSTMALHYLSNVLEWMMISTVTDPIEDFMEVLEPAMWGGFLYAFLQNTSQQQLSESRQRYKTLVENIDLGITLINADYEIVMTNAAEGRLFHKPVGQFLHGKCFEHFRQENRPCPSCPGIRAMATGLPAETESEGIREDGSRFPVRIRAFPVLDDSGQANAFIEMVEDISAIKQAESERRKFETQVRHAQKLESLGVLAGGIAHDFNNLLVAVMGNADLALEDMPAESPLRSYAEEIKQAARRASELTNQMLSYSGKGSFVIDQIDLNRVIREMIDLLHVSISKKVAIRYELTPEMPAIRGDASQVGQIVMNLITNASEAIDDQPGAITITTGRIEADAAYLASSYLNEDLPEGTYASLTVTDSGCGMNERVKAKIFDPFFTTKFSGRGLGMAAVLGIVRGHRGAIRVYSEPGEGSSIRVLLPAVDTPVTPPTESTEQDMADWRGEGTVLLVDDEDAVRNVASVMLQRLGFDVLAARNGAEAINTFSRKPESIDLVVLDLTMPKMDGRETFERMREIRPEVRVLLTSGYSASNAMDRFGLEGTVGFIQKPFEIRQIIAAMRKAFEPKTTATKP